MQHRTPADTLDNIREGGVSMLAVAKVRLSEVSKALEEGRFLDAQARAQDPFSKVSVLATAEQTLGHLTKYSVIRAAEVKVGMHVGPGVVTGVDTESHKCPNYMDGHNLVTLSWDQDQHTYEAMDEVCVRHEDDSEV